MSNIRAKARPTRSYCTACQPPKNPENTQIPSVTMVQVVYSEDTNPMLLLVCTMFAQVGELILSVPSTSELYAMMPSGASPACMDPLRLRYWRSAAQFSDILDSGTAI